MLWWEDFWLIGVEKYHKCFCTLNLASDYYQTAKLLNQISCIYVMLDTICKSALTILVTTTIYKKSTIYDVLKGNYSLQYFYPFSQRCRNNDLECFLHIIRVFCAFFGGSTNCLCRYYSLGKSVDIYSQSWKITTVRRNVHNFISIMNTAICYIKLIGCVRAIMGKTISEIMHKPYHNVITRGNVSK